MKPRILTQRKNAPVVPRAPDRPDEALADDTGTGLGPSALEVTARSLLLPGGVCSSFAVAGYPREVGAGWLEPLLTYPGRLDVSLHIEPVPPLVAAQRLRRQLARLEASSRANAEAGRLADFGAEAAADDAADLAASLARGHGRLFRLGLYLTVHAGNAEELTAEVERVRALCASLLLDAQPTTFRALQGWATTLPLGVDSLRMRRAFDTAALAAAFPFTSPDLQPALGDTPVLYGLNAHSSGVVLWDRFALDNHNSVTIARSGAGKSYLTKLELLRSLYQGVQIAVIDPEDEYRRLAGAVGGTRIALGAAGVCFNPFDLPAGDHDPETLIRRALFVQTLIATMLGEPLTPMARAVLDRCVVAAYAAAGITNDPRTWKRQPPLLTDLVGQLTLAGEGGSKDAEELAARLEPYVTGSYRGLFSGPTTTRPDGHLLVFALRDLPEEMRPVGMLLALDAIWRQVSNPHHRRRRLVVVDEAWTLMQQEAGARFLYRLAKSARKHWTGLAVVTQDAADLLSSDLGRAVIANAATQILLRQAPQVVEAVADAFDLTDGERTFLLAARQGEGLLCGTAGGSDRAAFLAIASQAEHDLVTTTPAEVNALEAIPEPGPSGANTSSDSAEEGDRS
ncbi:VirB4 family type IV secretion system protein [Actinomadura rupiterrae]|uniref:VirB4 family type IV secretion system protein n=1 Tax=Actinomadura rupiterrae TaxID=559627 RepID=UPI0020A29472|nr:ATP-binding protein [Actinomadura rupiterrae]MCP2342002.1 type IV secretory pathway VirB4 component [Actinomadura rupiterrae]